MSCLLTRFEFTAYFTPRSTVIESQCVTNFHEIIFVTAHKYDKHVSKICSPACYYLTDSSLSKSPSHRSSHGLSKLSTSNTYGSSEVSYGPTSDTGDATSLPSVRSPLIWIVVNRFSFVEAEKSNQLCPTHGFSFFASRREYREAASGPTTNAVSWLPELWWRVLQS